jgi:2'-5' RNA ligase
MSNVHQDAVIPHDSLNQTLKLMRYAVYCTPKTGHPLLTSIEPWFGRSAFGRQVATQPGPFSSEEHTALTASRARYGFHATFKAPFHLAAGYDADKLPLVLKGLATRLPTIHVGKLRVARFGDYLALTPINQPQALTDLAQSVVEAFEPARAPLSDHDLARRDKPDLSERERELLLRWGYAASEENFKFHMTLAGPVGTDLLNRAKAYLSELLAPVLAEPFLLDTLALFVEPDPPGPFNIIAEATLTDQIAN